MAKFAVAILIAVLAISLYSEHRKVAAANVEIKRLNLVVSVYGKELAKDDKQVLFKDAQFQACMGGRH